MSRGTRPLCKSQQSKSLRGKKMPWPYLKFSVGHVWNPVVQPRVFIQYPPFPVAEEQEGFSSQLLPQIQTYRALVDCHEPVFLHKNQSEHILGCFRSPSQQLGGTLQCYISPGLQWPKRWANPHGERMGKDRHHFGESRNSFSFWNPLGNLSTLTQRWGYFFLTVHKEQKMK